nr:uncharacterized protein LOC129155101 [Nothobranchius furzeri]
MPATMVRPLTPETSAKSGVVASVSAGPLAPKEPATRSGEPSSPIRLPLRFLCKIIRDGPNEKPHIPVTMEGTLVCEGIMDSGSDFTIMSSSLWQQVRMAAAAQGRVLGLVPCAVNIHPFFSGKMTLSNVVFLNFTVGDMSVSHPVFVANVDAFPFLLGGDLIQCFKAVISLGDCTLRTRLNQPTPLASLEDIIPSSGVINHNGAVSLISRSSTSEVGDFHSVGAVSAAGPLHPPKPPTLGGFSGCSDTPAETPHPAVGTPPAKGGIDGGADTPAEAQHLAVRTPLAEGRAEDITDTTALQLALVTSSPEVGDLPTKGEVEGHPVPLLADPDLSDCVNRGPPECSPALNPHKAVPVYNLKCSWFPFSALTKWVLLVACMSLISTAAEIPSQPPLTHLYEPGPSSPRPPRSINY